MQPEYLIERNKLKRQIFNWKVIAVVLVVVVSGFFFKFFNSDQALSDAPARTDYIASVYLDGIIMENKTRDDVLSKIADDKNIKAVILCVNSPGGGVGASEQLYSLIRKIALQKPVVAVMNSLAASGGYMASIAADYIVAHNSTITGSIGVIDQSAEITNLAERLGIAFNNFKSSPLKAAPNLMEKLTPEVREARMDIIGDIYNYFVDIVAERRKMPRDLVVKIADGRPYTGRQALELKLIDRIGGSDEALQWLQQSRNIDKNLKVFEVELVPKSVLQKILGDNVDQKIYSMLFSFGSGFFAYL